MSILEAIGNTPLVEIGKSLVSNEKIKIWAKFEGSNPGGSVKDRAALFMIKDAIGKGILTPQKTILEATSGNTGIALAMIASALGYKIKLFMPESVSLERQLILRAMGAELILTPGQQKTDGAIIAARKLFEKEPEKYFMPDQFSNPNNPLAHYKTTGPEIYQKLGDKIDYFVAGIGSGGTLTGCGRFLKEKIPQIKIIGVEPERNHHIQGLKNLEESIVPSVLGLNLIDEKIVVSDEEAFYWTRKLGANGIFVGISSGAAFAGVMKIVRKIKKGIIVTIFPDRGDRYLSTKLFKFTSCRRQMKVSGYITSGT
jgi:cysteine synthase B